jgi:hypothetical protein
MMTWPERIANYERVMQQPSYMWTEGRWAIGVWSMGNSYRKANDHYGGYQGNYLKRIAALFPDTQRVLHVFSGRIDLGPLPGDTVDIDAALNPTFVDDCQSLLTVPVENYDLAVVDPPYSVEDAEHYRAAPVNRQKVMQALERLPAGAHIVWLDQVLPMYSAKRFHREAMIGVSGSTNHRVRMVFIWRRLPHNNQEGTESGLEKEERAA